MPCCMPSAAALLMIMNFETKSAYIQYGSTNGSVINHGYLYILSLIIQQFSLNCIRGIVEVDISTIVNCIHIVSFSRTIFC